MGTDLRAAINTFSPRGELNPTSYIVLGATKVEGNKVQLAPFVGHWQTTDDGKNYWHLAAVPKKAEESAIFAGVGRNFFDEKMSIGIGTTSSQTAFTRELAAKLKLPANTQFTYSTEFSTWRNVTNEGTFNLKHQFDPAFNASGPTFIGFVETGLNGRKELRLGTSIEQGRWALDLTHKPYDRKSGAQLAHGFGEKGEHFAFITAEYDRRTKQWSMGFGANFTIYGFGKKNTQERRRPSRMQHRIVRAEPRKRRLQLRRR